jgi:hypothetical protein
MGEVRRGGEAGVEGSESEMGRHDDGRAAGRWEGAIIDGIGGSAALTAGGCVASLRGSSAAKEATTDDEAWSCVCAGSAGLV